MYYNKLQKHMKYITLLVLVFAFSMTISAQEEEESSMRSDWFMGGSVSYTNSNNVPIVFSSMVFTNLGNLSIVSIDPYIGKKINDYWDLGFGAFYSYRTDMNDNQGISSEQTRYSIRLFGRYYINPYQKLQVAIIPSVGFSETDIKNRSFFNDILSNMNSQTAAIGIALYYHLSSKIRLTAFNSGGSYRWGKLDIHAPEKLNFSEVKFNLNLSSIFLGVEVMF